MLAVLIAQVGRRARGGQGGPGTVGWVVIGGVIVLVMLVVAAAVRAERRKGREVNALLGERGFRQRLFTRKDKPEQAIAFAPFAAISWLKGGAKGLKWRADARLGERAAAIAQHTYMVYTGHGGHAVTATIVAVLCRGGWPQITLTRSNALVRLFTRKPKVRLEDQAFNERWRFSCADEGFALAVLSPEVQAAINAGQIGQWWVIGGGGEGQDGIVAIGVTASVNAKVLGEMIGRVLVVVGALPGEVREGMGLGVASHS